MKYEFKHKNIEGTCIYNEKTGYYSGYITTLTDKFIIYKGKTKKEIYESFKDSVENYLKEK